ncbi:MAG: methylmalonyl Co-A mutase-associated GTPase MeaB [Xanthobacteraceae bacterium]|nr:methylmalonyl Co-A mutase-associated GTPase MeaB [Xanthobacteraceae bacterium]
MPKTVVMPRPIAMDARADLATTLDRVASGHVRTISRCISEIENATARASELVAALDPRAGSALVIGVTGVPGGGKSTLVPELARRMARDDRRSAILAVDPSSPLSGGAILGDRIRASEPAGSGLFFRSVASRGSLGGLSRTLDDVVTLLDAAGYGAIVIETVGTGQSEIAVTRLAHTTLLVTAPGLGDEIQAMKAGILETADIIVVNKADSDPRGAVATAETLRNALSFSMRAHGLVEGANPATADRPASWHAPVRVVSALKGDGLEELVGVITAHRDFLAATQGFGEWRRRRRLARFREALRDALAARASADHEGLLRQAEDEVVAGASTPVGAATRIAETLIKNDESAPGRYPSAVVSGTETTDQGAPQ